MIRRRSLALSLAVAISATGVVSVTPAEPAHAASFNERNAVFTYLNDERESEGLTRFKRNTFLDDFAQGWAIKLSREASGTVSSPNRPLPPIDAEGTPVETVAIQCRDTKNTTGVISIDFGIRWCLKYANAYFSAGDTYNYMSVGVVESSTKTFAVMVMALYPDGAPLRLTSGTPSISGIARVGERLVARPGAWSPSTSVTYKYDWMIDGEVVQSTLSFRPSEAHHGKSVRLRVTGSRAGYWAAKNPRYSAPQTVAKGQVRVGTLAIQGTPNVGETVTAVPSAWLPSTAAFSYQWHRNGIALSGQTAATYTLVAKDQGAIVTVVVTGTHRLYWSKSQSATIRVGAPLTVAAARAG